jgi:inner membrane protein
MDSITQAALGATIGEAILGKKIGNKAALTGAIIATIPDLDVILYLFYDKLEMLSIHRGLSHSISFSILGALLIAIILSKLRWFKDLRYNILVLFSWLCLFTHILLDSFTAYGTQLLAPFSASRIGFDSINVVDPFYTVHLIMGLILSLWFFRSKKDRSRFNNFGLMISSLYLIFTLINKENVKKAISARMEDQSIEYNDLLTMPVGIGNTMWYGVAKGRDSIFMMKHSILSDQNHSIISFPINEHYLNEIDESIADKMRWFAKGFYTVDKIDKTIRIYNLQVDMRGIVQAGNKKAPTVGYFEITNKNGKSEFSSGSLVSEVE